MGPVPEHSAAEGPAHVAIIMDGNGRWAKARGLPRVMGHRKGAEAVRRTIEAAGECGVSYLTLFGFSSENWNRPEQEVGELMRLLRYYLQSETADLHAKGVKIQIIGDRTKFGKETVELIEFAENQTKSNDKLTLVLALSYGGRQEITEAVRAIAASAMRGEINADDINEDLVSDYLLTRDIPDPDLLIRTSGEQRISNFLLWQAAYTELVFVDRLW
ncbi:MAG: di-trans,poly-cis-decaprenylcistransferase, partial [Rhodospirillaceae bacterium]|nr:di-trans,poly-cis-decaprenylcistransferase [Rhodospirillaceae bacterium]